MTKKNEYGHFSRLGPATRNSWLGLKAAYRYEIAFRQEVWLFFLLTPVASWIADSFVEFALLISAVVGIMIAELLNSAVEAVVDRIGLERHELSGRAKDLGSAAVFVAICYFVIIWSFKIYSIIAAS